jgi:4a-hydroxytetrahydrobiopterin dehydratase
MALLNATEVTERLIQLPYWRLEGKDIAREFVFADFVAAMKFVNAVADEAEKARHHPDIDIRWNKVRLALSSHDAGGLTDQDFGLASTIDTLILSK